MTSLPVRRAQPVDRPALLALWERAVRATHDFLTEPDIEFYRPLVVEILASETLDWWVLAPEAPAPIAFLGLGDGSIEALFVDPAHRGKGHGRRLVAHAQAVLRGDLVVDVNEGNAAARRFYEALGFVVVGRSAVDDWGRAHPLLHLRRDVARAGTEPAPSLEYFGGCRD